MRRLLPLAVLVLAVLPAAASAAPKLPLSHAGRWITGADGRVAVLHGFNMVSKVAPYAPDATGFGADDAAFLQAHGFDTVRLGVIYKAVEPQPGVYDDAYLARIRRTVDVLAKRGIVSLLDFHQDMYNERFQGEGFPDWAILDDGLPAEPRNGFPGNYLTQPATQRAFDNFWDNKPGPGGIGIQDRFAAAWAHVASRFAGVPSVLGYELLNEPWPGANWITCLTGCPVDDARISAFNARLRTAIRKVDPSTLLFYEPNALANAGAPTTLADTGDANAVFSFHDYCSAAKAGEPYPKSCHDVDAKIFGVATAHVAKTGDALMLTEFGATSLPAVLTAVADTADRAMVGWQEWHYCACADPTTTGPGTEQALVIDPAKPPRGANVEAAKLRALTRPHPTAVAGTPTAFGFATATRAFTLRWSTARAGGGKRFGAGAITEVAVPKLPYPKGYAATVIGGRVVSARNAPVLRIAASKGASSVSLTVRPR